MKFEAFFFKVLLLLLYIFVIYVSYNNYKTNMIFLHEEYVNFIKEKYLSEVCNIIYEKIQDSTYIKKNYLIKVVICNNEKYFVTAFYETVVNKRLYVNTFVESFDWAICVKYFNNIEKLSEQIFKYYLEDILLQNKIYMQNLDLRNNVAIIEKITIEKLLEYAQQNISINVDYEVLKLFINNFVKGIDWFSYILTADFILYDMYFLKKILMEHLHAQCDIPSLFLQDFVTFVTIVSVALSLYYVIIPKIVLATILKNKSSFIIENVLIYFGQDQGRTQQEVEDLYQACLILYNERYTDLQRMIAGPETFIDYVTFMEQPILNQPSLLYSINENVANINFMLNILALILIVILCKIYNFIKCKTFDDNIKNK